MLHLREGLLDWQLEGHESQLLRDAVQRCNLCSKYSAPDNGVQGLCAFTRDPFLRAFRVTGDRKTGGLQLAKASARYLSCTSCCELVASYYTREVHSKVWYIHTFLGIRSTM